MENKRGEIIALHNIGKGQIEIVRMLGIPKQTVSYAIKRYKELGCTKDRPRSGRPCSANTPHIRKIIRDRVRRNPRRSMRQMAREIGISEASIRNIAKNELKLKSLKLQKHQHLDEKKCDKRLERCSRLLRERATGFQKSIIFSDEKFFSIEQAHNIQNDRVLSPDSSMANKAGRIVSRSQKPAGVMVWAGVSFFGKTELIFVKNGIKINSNNYISEILEDVVMPWAKQNVPNDDWIFQQDSAPAHRAKKTQEFCNENFPDFLTSNEWPPYSPDLNPLDYSIWGILQGKACAKSHKSVNSLKRDLVKAWHEISEETVRAAIDQFPRRLRACITAKGGIFENEFV